MSDIHARRLLARHAVARQTCMALRVVDPRDTVGPALCDAHSAAEGDRD